MHLQIEFEDEKSKPLAKLTPETPLSIAYLKGYTEIWGIIEKVGGRESYIVIGLPNDKNSFYKSE